MCYNIPTINNIFSRRTKMKTNIIIKALTMLLLSIIIVMSFASCGDDNNSTTLDSKTTPATTTQPTTEPTTTQPTIDPSTPEGRAMTELDVVKDYLENHFQTNDKWLPDEEMPELWIIKTSDGKYQCCYNGEPTKNFNLAYILELYKSDFNLNGTFSWNGDDVVYTLADGSASATWQDIDAFDIDAYMESDEYQQIIINARKASLKAELNQLARYLQVEIISNNGSFEISEGVVLTNDDEGNFSVSSGTLADAFNTYAANSSDFSRLSGAFKMDGDTLIYYYLEDEKIFVTWDESVK